MTFSGREPSRVDGTTGAVRVMEALCASSRPLSVREIEERVFVPKSTVHRILLSLEKQQWVYRESGTGGYRPGVSFLLLSSEFTFYEYLIRAADPWMARLMTTTGNTAILSVLEGVSGCCIHTVEPSVPVKFTACRGMPVPLHVGATGKILLAYAPPEIRSHVLSLPLVSPIRQEPVNPSQLKEELEQIRQQGYATSREEWMLHAGDISVPLFDRKGAFVAQLGIAGVAEGVFRGFDETLRLLKEAAESIGSEMN